MDGSFPLPANNALVEFAPPVRRPLLVVKSPKSVASPCDATVMYEIPVSYTHLTLPTKA